jgi:hypothetical protein
MWQRQLFQIGMLLINGPGRSPKQRLSASQRAARQLGLASEAFHAARKTLARRKHQSSEAELLKLLQLES